MDGVELMVNRIGVGLALGFFACFTPLTAQAQELSRWMVSHTTTSCGLVTNNELQSIPSSGFGLSAEARDQVTILIRGNMDTDGEQPQSASVQFGNARAPARSVSLVLLDEPNNYGLLIVLDVEYLRLFAEAESFAISLDGDPFATYALAERGQMVVALARCMRNLP